MALASEIKAYGNELYEALRARRTLEPLSVRNPGLTIEDAYGVSLAFLKRRLADGERTIGKKIGLTSVAVQEMLGVRQPDFGFLTDAMQVADGGTVELAKHLIQPRAEAEIAFRLEKELKGPGVTMQHVLEATEYVAACFEIVDSRVQGWKVRIVDTIADNASCGVFVIGPERIDPRGTDLAILKAVVRKNGELVSEGLGSAVQGSPLASVAWLANRLADYGVSLAAGDIVLSGSLVPLEPVAAGDVFEMDLGGIGTASVRFV
jgi:2-oxopent-4-enoate/cis-2-oxohex-4-enoate hydratase